MLGRRAIGPLIVSLLLRGLRWVLLWITLVRRRLLIAVAWIGRRVLLPITLVRRRLLIPVALVRRRLLPVAAAVLRGAVLRGGLLLVVTAAGTVALAGISVRHFRWMEREVLVLLAIKRTLALQLPSAG